MAERFSREETSVKDLRARGVTGLHHRLKNPSGRRLVRNIGEVLLASVREDPQDCLLSVCITDRRARRLGLVCLSYAKTEAPEENDQRTHATDIFLRAAWQRKPTSNSPILWRERPMLPDEGCNDTNRVEVFVHT